jgi:hypothetical protein
VVRDREARIAADYDGEGACCVYTSVRNTLPSLQYVMSSVPIVLNAKIRINAPTCIGVLYAPLFFDPQAGLSASDASCRLANSDLKIAVGMSAQDCTSIHAG